VVTKHKIYIRITTNTPMKSKQKLFGLFTGLYLAVFGIENADAYYEKPNFEKPKMTGRVERIISKEKITEKDLSGFNNKISEKTEKIKDYFCREELFLVDKKYVMAKLSCNGKNLGYSFFEIKKNGLEEKLELKKRFFESEETGIYEQKPEK
jgi:hypothetical protein